MILCFLGDIWAILVDSMRSGMEELMELLIVGYIVTVWCAGYTIQHFRRGSKMRWKMGSAWVIFVVAAILAMIWYAIDGGGTGVEYLVSYTISTTVYELFLKLLPLDIWIRNVTNKLTGNGKSKYDVSDKR